MFDKIHHECGVFGVYSQKHNADVAEQTFFALFALQHRGQESCGIAVNDDGVIRYYKDLGLVPEVFTKEILDKELGLGNMAVGHARYSTTGTLNRANAQPLVVHHIKGNMALAHNGNLTNAQELREEVEWKGAIFHTTNDSEVISYIITQERLRSPSIETAVEAAMGRLKGAYSLIVMSATKLIAARDPNGFHPLCMGERDGDIIFASESCALDSLGATFIRDVDPGEIIMVNRDGIKSIRTHCGKPASTCVFEFIYFARPDSVIEGNSVHGARLQAGKYLYQEHPVQADVVIGVPDSGLDAALGFSQESGISYGVGFIKNRYIGRTFIQPSQEQRDLSVRIKLNVISETVKGKRVVMIDDSIVRGTTSGRIVKLLREAGAKEVHMRVSSPPFKHACYYGTDIDNEDTLIANHKTVEEIAQEIGVDSLGFLSLKHVKQLTSQGKSSFCAACFDGEYPVEPPKTKAKNRFEQKLTKNQEEKKHG